MKLNEAIEKMNGVYLDSREQLATIHAALDAAQETEQRVRADIHMTETDRADKLRELQGEVWRLRDKAQAIEQKAQEQLERLADEVTAARAPQPQDVDRNALELIDSGVLTAQELLAIGEQYNGNTAMQRLIGARLVSISEDSKNSRFDRKTAEQLRLAGRELSIRSQSTAEKEITENLLAGLKAGCRADRALADAAHHAVYDSALADAKARAAALDAAAV